MIKSIWTVSFEVTHGNRAGAVFVLLDFGDDMEDEPRFPVAQGTATSVPIFSPWGNAFALGGAMSQATWTRRRNLSARLPRTQGLLDAYKFPWGQQGNLRVSIQGGATWRWERSVVESSEPTHPPHHRNSYLTQSYSAQCGKMVLEAGPLPVGTPADWDLLVTNVSPNWQSITTPWASILTTPIN